MAAMFISMLRVTKSSEVGSEEEDSGSLEERS